VNHEHVLAAVIFDLDGVITLTARVHSAAWKALFDDFLKRRAQQQGEEYRPFDAEFDYLRYVDGKPRIDGVLSFLASRHVHLPLGDSSENPVGETAWGLANRKNILFKEMLQRLGVEVDQEAVRVVRELRSEGVKVGLASSSKNTELILKKSGLRPLFDTVVDGVVSEIQRLRGKPEPDIFLYCLHRLSRTIQPRHAAVFEDAIPGVQAAWRGEFGLVVGVDRQNLGKLQRNGASWVIRDFHGVTADRLMQVFGRRGEAA
jgi:beta-phosphoglucomutase family hydrolase